MWILECDGDLLEGRKLWLKPGNRYLFGRTSSAADGPNERTHAIIHKSVSRKHIVFSVDAVKPGQASEIYSGSTLIISDNSKLGTSLDGVRLIKESKTLTRGYHTIRLGSFEQILKINWRPVVLTVHFSERDLKRIPLNLDTVREKLERFDIKIVSSYVIDATTHFVSSKRNVPNGLQALINGKYIVTHAYIDAIEKVCVPRLNADGSLPTLHSLLEDDLEANWPDATKYLPGPGKESNPRPTAKFAPNPRRINIFEGLTFVFGEPSQFEQLQAAVTNGGAKALLFKLQFGRTTPKEFIDYVRSVAESKGLDDINDATTKKGVIIVRFRGRDDTEQWALNFLRSVDLALGQRSVEQSEFLDAILQDDASALKRPLEEDDAPSPPTEPNQPPPPPPSSSAPPPGPVPIRNTLTRSSRQSPGQDVTVRAEDSSVRLDAPTEAPKVVSKGKFRRLKVKSRFNGFDDFDADDDIISVSPLMQSSAHPVSGQSDPGDERLISTSMEQDSQPLFVTDSQPSDQLQQGLTNSAAHSSTRKRRHPLSEEEDAQNGESAAAAMLDNLLPGAVAAKKRRIEREAEEAAAILSGRASRAGSAALDTSNPASNTRSNVKKPPASKLDKLNIREAVRSHASKLDAERDENRQNANMDHSDDEMMSPEQIARLQDLAIVEEMELPVRRMPASSQRRRDANHTASTSSEPSERWDDRWNGLKNFKNFRRKGERGVDVRNQPRKVIVGLVEFKANESGDFWLERSDGSSGRKSQRRRSHDEDEESFGASQTRGRGGAQTFRNLAPQKVTFDENFGEDDDGSRAGSGFLPNDMDYGDGDSGIHERHDTPTMTAIMSRSSASASAPKRPPTARMTNEQPPPKIQRQTRQQTGGDTRRRQQERGDERISDDSDDDDDDDEPKFRLRHR